MVITNYIFDWVWEVHAFQNIAAHGWVDLHLCEFRFGKLAGLVQDVFRHSQLSNVVKQGASYKRVYFRFTDFQQLAHLSSINLGAPHVAVSRLVLGIDGDGQRLDGVHVEVRDLFGVSKLLNLRSRNFCYPLLVKAVDQMHQYDN